MRVVKITRYGTIDGLEIVEMDNQEASADRVRVRVHAAGLNRADLLQRRGKYPGPPGVFRDVPGLEFAGEVDQLGDEVKKWKIGQRVFGIASGGAQAEYIVVPESHLVEIPDNLNWIEAASIPEAFITAHDALFTQAQLRMGERVIIHAIGSGVGIAAAQLALATGAMVFGTTRNEEKLAKAKTYGSINGIATNDPKAFIDALDNWTNGEDVNVILDLVGASYFEANLKALASMGRMMLVGTMSGALAASVDLSVVMRKRLKLIGTVLRSRSTEEKAYATHQFAVHVLPLLKNGTLRPVIDKVYQMDQIKEAHEHLESNKNFGKIVLAIN
jgi:NADPH:quinone reductase